MTRPAIPEALLADRIVAIARGLDGDEVRRLLPALREGGVRVVEITLDSPGALDTIAEHAATDGVVLGAGTVLDSRDAADAVSAGATFLVSPHVDTEAVSWAASRGVPFLAGGVTPTEIVTAWNAGAAAAKVFPARLGGPDHLRDLRGPLSHIPLVPTGGVSAGNAADYLAAGAVAVGLGSWLTQSPDPEEIRARAVAAIRACRPIQPV